MLKGVKRETYDLSRWKFWFTLPSGMIKSTRKQKETRAQENCRVYNNEECQKLKIDSQPEIPCVASWCLCACTRTLSLSTIPFSAVPPFKWYWTWDWPCCIPARHWNNRKSEFLKTRNLVLLNLVNFDHTRGLLSFRRSEFPMNVSWWF